MIAERCLDLTDEGLTEQEAQLVIDALAGKFPDVDAGKGATKDTGVKDGAVEGLP